MEKFCTNCGKEFNNDDMFCMQCGTKREMEQPAPQPVAPAMETAPLEQETPVMQKETYTYAESYENDNSEKPGRVDMILGWVKKNVKWVAIGGGALLAVIILLAILVGSSGDYTKPLDNYIDLMNGDIDVIADMAPEAYWEYCEDELDKDLDDMIEEYEELYEDFILESLEEEYGEDISFSYEIVDEKELSTKKLDAIKDGLKENYDIAKKSVTDGMELEVELTIEGDDDEDSDETDMYVVKIDGDWYTVTSSGSFSFMN